MLTNIDKAMEEFVTWISKTEKEFQNDTEALNYFLGFSDSILLYLKNFKDLQFFALFLCHEKNYKIDLESLDPKRFANLKADFEQSTSSYSRVLEFFEKTELEFFEKTEEACQIKRQFRDFDDLISVYDDSIKLAANPTSLFEIFKYKKALLKDYSYAAVFANYLRNNGINISSFDEKEFNLFKGELLLVEKMPFISKGKMPEESVTLSKKPKDTFSIPRARKSKKTTGNANFFVTSAANKRNITVLPPTPEEVEVDEDELELMASELEKINKPKCPSSILLSAVFDTPDYVSPSPQSELSDLSEQIVIKHHNS